MSGSKMILLMLTIYIVASSPVTSTCYFSHQTFRCNGTEVEFLESFYKLSPDNSSVENIYLLDGQWPVIEYFPNHNFPNDHGILTIRNSSVQSIFERAFEDISNVVTLDLSSNLLVDITFVKFVSPELKKLCLNDNKINALEQAFGHLRQLEILEMSGNQISVLDFSKLSSINRINFSRNFIAILENKNFQYTPIMNYDTIDLSSNNLSQYDEKNIGISTSSLDLSHNHLECLQLRHYQLYHLNIINTSLHHLDYITIETLYISSNETEIANMVNFHKLILRNNNIFKLSKDTLNIIKSLQRNLKKTVVDLSHLSIEDISEDYFRGIHVNTLNLSYNNINRLGGRMFSGSVIDSIDLIHSNIKNLIPGVFNDVDIKSLDLRFNEISSIKNVFQKVQIGSINLSFNHIRVIKKYSFVNCFELHEIILSHCGIEKIEIDSFINLTTLTKLDLSHNKLLILEENTFNNLPMKTLNLYSNPIETIRSQAFNNLPELRELSLSDLKINNLENNAFFDLPNVRMVDLRNNELSIISPSLFVDMENLNSIDFSGNSIKLLSRFSNKLKLDKLVISFNGSFASNAIFNHHIKYLSIEKSWISILENGSFSGLYNLKELYFTQSDIFHIDSEALKDLFNLQFLDSRNLFKLTKHLRKNTFADLRYLKFLDLSKLILEKLDEHSFRGLRNLERLIMDHNNLVNITKNVFIDLDCLKMLDLSYNKIINLDNGVFEALPNLKELNLGYNKLSELSRNTFAGFSSLGVLNLQNNNISSIDVEAFSQLVSLKELFLQNNQITKIPIGSLHYLSNLRILNLSYNHIELFENGVFSNIKSLEILDLSNTSLIKLEDESIFFSMMNLKKLYIDKNHLKQFDMKRFLTNLKTVIYVGISGNKWKCDTLSLIIEIMNHRNVGYQTNEPIYGSHNIDGIRCLEICEFVYCPPRMEEPNY